MSDQHLGLADNDTYIVCMLEHIITDVTMIVSLLCFNFQYLHANGVVHRDLKVCILNIPFTMSCCNYKVDFLYFNVECCSLNGFADLFSTLLMLTL